jgi:hypothetical protein
MVLTTHVPAKLAGIGVSPGRLYGESTPHRAIAPVPIFPYGATVAHLAQVLPKADQLLAHTHDGFWRCMDNVKDLKISTPRCRGTKRPGRCRRSWCGVRTTTRNRQWYSW